MKKGKNLVRVWFLREKYIYINNILENLKITFINKRVFTFMAATCQMFSISIESLKKKMVYFAWLSIFNA